MCADNLPSQSARHLSNGAIAAELMALAQFLTAKGANPFKVGWHLSKKGAMKIYLSGFLRLAHDTMALSALSL
jgi:hypothetical protein